MDCTEFRRTAGLVEQCFSCGSLALFWIWAAGSGEQHMLYILFNPYAAYPSCPYMYDAALYNVKHVIAGGMAGLLCLRRCLYLETRGCVSF